MASERESGEVGTNRLEAFSDGVFAIAITLLVLELKVPSLHDTGDGAGLGAALRGQWPSYVGFFGSFATILIMWINHHTIFSRLRRADHGVLLLNGLLLLVITFIPFPTALLAEHLGHEGEHLAAALYSGTDVALAVAFNLLWLYVARNERLLHPEVHPEFVRRFTRTYLLGPPLYLIAFVLAFVNVAASLAVCIALAIVFALPSPRPTPPLNGVTREG